MSLVTLTFDNGPTVATTPFVLECLQDRGLSAYFCVVGLQLRASHEQADIARETLARNHLLVNHSMTHGIALGDEPSRTHALREINEMHLSMNECLGDWGKPYFRPCGRGGVLGRHLLSESAVRELEALEYSVLIWNCVPRDWEDPQGWVAVALEDIDERDHAVVVLHDLDTGAMKSLPSFLDTLLARGHRVTTELPADCLPMLNGKLQWSDAEFRQLISVE